MKNSYVIVVCTALLISAGTVFGQQSANSVTTSATASGETNGLCLKDLAGQSYRPRSGRNENSPALQRWVSGQQTGSEAAMRKTETWTAVTISIYRERHHFGCLTIANTYPKRSDTSSPPKPDSDDDSWHFEIAPYLWAAALKGDLRVRNTTAKVDASFSDLFHQLDFAFATRAEASKQRWTLTLDENYMNLGTTGTGPLGETTDIQPTLNFFEVGTSYAPVIIRNENSTANEPLPPVFSLEVLGGLRYTHFGLGLQRGTNPPVEGSRNLVDFFGGNRFKVRPHPAFTMIGKYTLGGGGSHFAWTVSALGDFRFRKNMSVWGGYQILHMDADQAANTIGFNGRLHGLISGLSIYK